MTEAVALGIVGFLLAFVVPAVGWLVSRVLAAGETVGVHGQRITALEGAHAKLDEAHVKLDEGQLTRDCVREVIDEALDKRDVAAAERRQHFDETLALKIKAAVRDGQAECQRQTRLDLESMVPRIVHEVVQQTTRHRRVDPDVG